MNYYLIIIVFLTLFFGVFFYLAEKTNNKMPKWYIQAKNELFIAKCKSFHDGLENRSNFEIFMESEKIYHDVNIGYYIINSNKIIDENSVIDPQMFKINYLHLFNYKLDDYENVYYYVDIKEVP